MGALAEAVWAFWGGRADHVCFYLVEILLMAVWRGPGREVGA